MNKAKEKVKVDYNFVKGRSRSKSDDSPEISPKVKRAKLNAEERLRQIKLMQENMESLSSRLSFKQKQLEKERRVSNFKQCDMICKEMIELRKERASVDQQLAALVKKEAKSSWYLKSASNKTKKVHGESKKKRCQDNQQSLPSLLRKSSSSSTCSSDHQSDDTIIISDGNMEIEKDSQPSTNEEQVKDEWSDEEIFSQAPPEPAVEGSQII
jgi:glucan-binding YG repeat protein